MTEKTYAVESKFNGFLKVIELNTGINRIWANVGDVLDLTETDIRNILNTPGGRKILLNYVVIKDADLLKKFNLDVQPEYFYTVTDIDNLLTKGTIDQLKDALDFAPAGTIELIVDEAVKLRLNDRNKIDAISAATGTNVAKKIEIVSEVVEEKTESKTRRAQPFVSSVKVSSEPVFKK